MAKQPPVDVIMIMNTNVVMQHKNTLLIDVPLSSVFTPPSLDFLAQSVLPSEH